MLEAAGADDVVVGDLLDAASTRRAVAGCDSVLFATGSRIGTALTRPWRVVDETGLRTLVEAARAEDVRRVVFLSSLGVGTSRRGMPRWARWVVLRWSIRAKERAEAVLRDSGLEYTTFRPGWLTDDPATGEVVLTEGSETMTGSVSRADVARLMVGALFTPEASNRTFEVVDSESVRRDDPRKHVSVEWNYERRSAVAVGER
jgi:uncharacterized protein YbjT (DUF2867 family)